MNESISNDFNRVDQADFALEADVMKPLETSERIEICIYLSILIIFGMGMQIINQSMHYTLGQ